MKDFVTYQVAIKLKEKGFNEPCFLHYTNTGGVFSNSIDTYDRPNQELDYSDFQLCFNDGNSIGLIDAPTISQVLKWLREKELHVEFIANASGYCYIISRTPQRCGSDLYSCFDSGTNDAGEWDDYEEAALHAIEYILDNLI